MFYGMSHMQEFVVFDLKSWLDGKDFIVGNIEPWVDFETKTQVGKKVTVRCVKDDNSAYRLKDGETFSNLDEKFTVKVEKFVGTSGDRVSLEKVNAVLYTNKRTSQNGNVYEVMNVSFKGGELLVLPASDDVKKK